MVNLLEYNTKRDLAKLNPEKTEIIKVSKALQTHPKKSIIGGQEINRVQSIKHLGITYQENGKINIEERLSIGRRTIYALLGRGLHAKIRNVPSSSTENLEYIRCPTVSIWARNPGIYIIRHDEIKTASRGHLQTISMPSRANRSSSYLHTNRGRINRDNAGQKCNDLVDHLSQARLIH